MNKNPICWCCGKEMVKLVLIWEMWQCQECGVWPIDDLRWAKTEMGIQDDQ
ncbi:MAG: hypothetical protein DDT33_01640 [Firmicutes bacterium]|nr:hypothetical protein [Bacillota bacterium]